MAPAPANPANIFQRAMPPSAVPVNANSSNSSRLISAEENLMMQVPPFPEKQPALRSGDA